VFVPKSKSRSKTGGKEGRDAQACADYELEQIASRTGDGQCANFSSSKFTLGRLLIDPQKVSKIELLEFY
jgi:hypothetical protein